MAMRAGRAKSRTVKHHRHQQHQVGQVDERLHPINALIDGLVEALEQLLEQERDHDDLSRLRTYTGRRAERRCSRAAGTVANVTRAEAARAVVARDPTEGTDSRSSAECWRRKKT